MGIRHPHGPVRTWAVALLLLPAASVTVGCARSAPLAAAAAPVTSLATPGPGLADPRCLAAWSTPAAPLPSLTRAPSVARLPLGEGPQRGPGTWWRDPAPGAHASRAAALGFGLASVGVLAWGDASLRGTSGDVLQVALPAMAVAAVGIQQDTKGLRQFGLALGATMALAHGTKAWVAKDRPDGGKGDSFPSAHTAAAFAGAAFLQQRYGMRLGMPAFVLAAHTAATRVAADRHYLDDVVAGAGLGLLSSWLLVDPSCDDEAAVCQRRASERRHCRIAFAYTAVIDTDDEARSPGATGDSVNLSDLSDETERVTASARASVEWWPSARHTWSAVVDPVDITDQGALASSRSFGGQTFAAGIPLASTHHHHRYQLAWRYALREGPPLQLEAGGGLLLTDYRATLVGGGRHARVERLYAMPFAQATSRLALLPSLWAQAGAAAGAWNDSWFVELDAQLRWQVDRRWDVSLGLRALKARTDDEEFANRLEVLEVFVAFGRSF